MYLFIYALIHLCLAISNVCMYIYIYAKKQITLNGERPSISLHASTCNMFVLLEFLRNLVLKCPTKIFRYFIFGLDKVHEAGRQLLTTVARHRSQANFYRICERNLPLRQGFLHVFRWSAVGIFPPSGPYISVISHLVTSA